MSKIPRPLSPGEETLALHLRAHEIAFVREYEFARPRKYRFDFAFPDKKIAIEIDGGTKFGQSRHSRGKGYEDDCTKLNTAVKMGWAVLRYTTEMVERGDAINDVLEAMP